MFDVTQSTTIPCKDILIYAYILRNDDRQVLQVFTFHNQTIMSLLKQKTLYSESTMSQRMQYT